MDNAERIVESIESAYKTGKGSLPAWIALFLWVGAFGFGAWQWNKAARLEIQNVQLVAELKTVREASEYYRMVLQTQQIAKAYQQAQTALGRVDWQRNIEAWQELQKLGLNFPLQPPAANGEQKK